MTALGRRQDVTKKLVHGSRDICVNVLDEPLVGRYRETRRVAVKKILFAIALLMLAATNAEAHGGRHGHGGGGHFFIFAPPIFGAPIFPYYYPSVWVGAGPYYPSSTYYVQSPPNYVVTEAPERSYVAELPRGGAMAQSPVSGVVELGPVSALQPQSPKSRQVPTGQWFVYPSKGQSQEQQARDRNDCNGWAVGQTGYDPNLPSQGGSSDQAQTTSMDYGRAVSACLEGRGYAIR
jgi:hypothetical protein